ncbi:WD40 repeat-like protein [Trichocladium antarcticum]|uniref:WD40 repeat-like protein n=1 Tax=Trichocladium antarcticum TaxID=1450529 RepID=A0AAN6UPA0_9PEZI|nr:WD40 repeat-like protein [Trichocladium antarcticum]
MAAGASADKKIYVMEINSGKTMTLEGHTEPVRTVRFVDIPAANAPILASGSWDKTVRYWDLRQPTSIGSLQLPERVYAMDAAGPFLVAATPDKNVHLVNLHANPAAVWKSVKSPLSRQPRAVAVSADGSRWAISGIDGRAAAQVMDEKKDTLPSLSFKCHRTAKTKSMTDVFAVHAVAFSPAPAHKNDVLVTAGSDGAFSIWDVRSRQRLRASPAVGGPITAAAFNRDGTALAYAVGYDWAKGYAGNDAGAVRKIVLHGTAEVKR